MFRGVVVSTTVVESTTGVAKSAMVALSATEGPSGVTESGAGLPNW